MKKALWITCGPRGNAGDGLLYDVTRALFAGRVDLDFRFVSEQPYLRPGDDHDNIVIGPGGLFVQTNSSKHLHQKLSHEWDEFGDKRFHLWSTGILQRPKPEQVPQIKRVTDRADQVVVRATKEAEYFHEVAGVDAKWSPCASLFIDKLLDIEPATKDVVVVNFDDHLFTADNIADHPFQRFIDYARSEGLEVRSMVNAAGDSNKYMLDMFPVIDADQPFLQSFLASDQGQHSTVERLKNRVFSQGMNEAIRRMPSFGARYNSARFAFGKRLHGWLPFMSFDRPAAFIGMAARRGMSKDYFDNDDFVCATRRNRDQTRDELDQTATTLINRLKVFIDNEDRLSARIAAKRERLWQRLSADANDFASNLR